MNGGRLVQHCTKHGIFGTHPIWILQNRMVYEITSTHHQMQYPYNLPSKDYTLVAISKSFLSLNYEGDLINSNSIRFNGEPEIVIYHKENMPKCIAIQGHPEYMRKESPIVEYLNNLINHKLEK